MREPLPDLAGFSAALTDANVDVSELEANEKGTFCTLLSSFAPAPPALTVLSGTDSAEIVIKRKLSHGGMGEILLAEQQSLGREVAVKVTMAGKGGTRAQAELIVEARVAGQLEHPNIVPVHILGQSSDGKPLIVMKRIEGESWRALLKAGRDLKRDVDVLMEVCRALSFAHARGVVHRDVKPANVMVGSFGEVYLLDWGIAVGFGDHALPELQHAQDVNRVAGTAKYMAPEMALPDPAHNGIDHRTDVYLVGAVLCELLTGAPPHRGKTTEEVLYAAHTAAPPQFADDVHDELAAICRAAMRRDPLQRTQSVEEVRLALEAFKSHAAARELCSSAEERLGRLIAMPHDAMAGDAQRIFTECRFGFTQALRTWPESTRARSGLTRALVAMALREAGAGHFDSASLLAAELEHVPEELTAALATLARQRAVDAKRMETLSRVARDQDLQIGARERVALMFATTLSWLALLTAAHVLARTGTWVAGSGTFALLLAPVVVVVGAAGLLWPRIRDNAMSRTMYLALLACCVATLVAHIVGWRFALPPAPALAMAHIIIAVTVFFASGPDRRLWWAAVVAASVVPVLALWPNAAYLISGVGTFISSVAVALVVARLPADASAS